MPDPDSLAAPAQGKLVLVRCEVCALPPSRILAGDRGPHSTAPGPLAKFYIPGLMEHAILKLY